MNRRQLLIGSAIGAAGAAALPLAGGARAAGAMSHELQESLQACTPADALSRLQEGNARFAKAWGSTSGIGTPQQRMSKLNLITQLAPRTASHGARLVRKCQSGHGS
ncbi:MAG: hypothetical protein ACKOXO_02795 [Cyanobium sp.]